MGRRFKNFTQIDSFAAQRLGKFGAEFFFKDETLTIVASITTVTMWCNGMYLNGCNVSFELFAENLWIF
jgi:hypothetical protein